MEIKTFNSELLKYCTHGGTHNPNESVNRVVLSRVPKKAFVQLELLSLDAISSFKMGNVSKPEILRLHGTGNGEPRQTEAVVMSNRS
ncbi:hypothetical protein TNCV_503801 [Trichonephila clavipes]|nr:hypothetical protein TNCV_503801 [Trichonephila clavipes]